MDLPNIYLEDHHFQEFEEEFKSDLYADANIRSIIDRIVERHNREEGLDLSLLPNGRREFIPDLFASNQLLDGDHRAGDYPTWVDHLIPEPSREGYLRPYDESRGVNRLGHTGHHPRYMIPSGLRNWSGPTCPSCGMALIRLDDRGDGTCKNPECHSYGQVVDQTLHEDYQSWIKDQRLQARSEEETIEEFHREMERL